MAPPALLPGSHFAAAQMFLLLGTAGIVAVAPALAAGSFLDPRVAAVTHLFTLGWITTSIMGALYQFLPVALGRPITWPGLAQATLILYAPGLLAFVAGIAFSRTTLMLVGAVTFGTAIVLFIANLAVTLRASDRRDVTWWALACATFYLGVTLVLGLALTGNLRWGYLGAGRLNALGVHLHVALAGWVLLVMIGVAHRLLPMFLLSHGAGDRFAKAAVALVATGSGVLALLHHAPPLVSHWLPSLLIALGCAAFLVQARAYYVKRHRRTLDPAMRLAAAGLALLMLALLVSWPVVFGLAAARLAVGYVMAVILGMSLFVAAHHYRIVPFLVWYHRFGPLAGKRAVPRVNELYSAGTARAAAVAQALGALTLIAAVMAGSALAARLTATVLLTGVLIQVSQMHGLWRLRP